MSSYTTDMSQAEQIGQAFMVGFEGLTPSQEVVDLIQNYHVGGIILFSRNVQDTQQTLELTQSLQRIAQAAGHRYPLLISIDQENGMGQRLGAGSTLFPGSMALGAVGSEQITYEIALATGRELKAQGVNMDLAPVVDVNNNPANPVIGTRSFGEDPQQVARLASAAVKGFHDAGVISNLKHFPGHGDTSVDSHLALPTIPHSLARLEEIELVPFRSGIEAGADSVMIAHIYFPSLMRGEALPATVSPAVIRGLLREQLGFEGMIVSDCMEMDAITNTVGAERAAVMALQASTDLVLVSHTYTRQRGSLEAVRAALEAKELSEDVVRQAAERVLAVKARYLSWDDLPGSTVPEWVGGTAHAQLRDRAYALSTTVIRNDAGLLPLHLEPAEQILVVTRQKARLASTHRRYPSALLTESIRQQHGNVSWLEVSPHPTEEERLAVLRAASAADVIIMATVNANLDQQEAELMQALIQLERRIIGIALANPYDLLAFPQLRTYVATYEYTIPALTAAVQTIFGATPPQGRLPVSLPGLYPLAHATADGYL